MTDSALLPGSTMHAERTVLEDALMSNKGVEDSRAGKHHNAILQDVR